METQNERVVQSDEGLGCTDAACEHAHEAEGSVSNEQPQPPVGEGQPPAGYENTPRELWPDENGNPPTVTAELVKRLRGKYFTVRHVPMPCGHKLDVVNEPSHRNCETCWFYFFNTHPQLVEVADQMYRTLGANAVMGLRGGKFVKMFKRYMATMYHIMKAREDVAGAQAGNDAGSLDGKAIEAGEGRSVVAELAADGTQGTRISSGLIS